MPNVGRHAPGDFCWIELSTSNQNAAKSFYTALLGWTTRDAPMGPDAFYTTFESNGRAVGAAYTMCKEEVDAGIAPHWNVYVAVASADDAAKKAEQLGGKILTAALDVMDLGRMAVIQDPTGAVFSLWEAKQHSGMAVTGDPGAFCWADLVVPDQAKARKFYEGLFGWTFEPGKRHADYLHIKHDGRYIGGLPAPHPSTESAPPHWLVYVAVNDVDATFARAKDLNARILLRPMDYEGEGRVAMVADRQGAGLAVTKRNA